MTAHSFLRVQDQLASVLGVDPAIPPSTAEGFPPNAHIVKSELKIEGIQGLGLQSQPGCVFLRAAKQ